MAFWGVGWWEIIDPFHWRILFSNNRSSGLRWKCNFEHFTFMIVPKWTLTESNCYFATHLRWRQEKFQAGAFLSIRSSYFFTKYFIILCVMSEFSLLLPPRSRLQKGLRCTYSKYWRKPFFCWKAINYTGLCFFMAHRTDTFLTLVFLLAVYRYTITTHYPAVRWPEKPHTTFCRELTSQWTICLQQQPKEMYHIMPLLLGYFCKPAAVFIPSVCYLPCHFAAKSFPDNCNITRTLLSVV